MFAERLEQLAERIGHVRAVSLIAGDGIPIETHPHDPGVDVEALAAEMVSQAQAVATNHEEISPGPVRYLAVSTVESTLVVSAVKSDYYFLTVLEPGANFGRARFELRRAVLDFEMDLV